MRFRYIEILDDLIDALLDLRQIDSALGRAKQLLDHDPLHEAAYRRLMKVYAVQGNRPAAVRVYHACASILQKELGVEPSPNTGGSNSTPPRW
ncbi:MAG: bacterial transcriptional activator domain-containing protein [Chloroflexota bacterium]|nr:bacterial transcriptional activator domain-containing protein [Chloroflexota bacterium]